MKIFLVSSPFSLPFYLKTGVFSEKDPFWQNECNNQKLVVLDHEAMAGWSISSIRGDYITFSKHCLYPLFKAISQMDMQNKVIAYISLAFDYEKRQFNYSIGCDIQFSTMPAFVDGVPQVYSKEGEVLVQGLLVFADTQNDPYKILGIVSNEYNQGIHTEDFWEKFLINKLRTLILNKLKEYPSRIMEAQKFLDDFSDFQ